MTDLTGCLILVVDDEPLVALDIAPRLQSEGGSVKTAHGLADGLRLAGHPTSRPQSWTTGAERAAPWRCGVALGGE